MNLLEEINKYDIILGSESKRRKEILLDMGIQFSIQISNFQEKIPKDVKKENIPLLLAKQKANNLSRYVKRKTLMITADTIVLCKNEIFNKPKNKAESIKMLEILSGKSHKVITGICLTSFEKQICFSETTDVSFKKLSTEEIKYYVNNFKPFDKAGSYGIQEWIGKIGVKKIKGSYSNVVGLPSCSLFEKLINFV